MFSVWKTVPINLISTDKGLGKKTIKPICIDSTIDIHLKLVYTAFWKTNHDISLKRHYGQQ